MATILIVEDEMVIALGVSMVLEQDGYRVVTAPDGVRGLVMAREEEPDLVITDYMMPRMDGLEMIRQLREAGFRKPVILATSVSQERAESNPHAPYDAYLRKPYSDAVLMETVRRLLSGGRRDGAGPVRRGKRPTK